MLKTYKDLLVWQKSYHLCLELYRITQRFPNEEKFGITAQNTWFDKLTMTFESASA